MGKTYRRKDVNPKGEYWSGCRQAPNGISDSTVADNIFHSDKPKRWKGISSNVKDDQKRAQRSEDKKAVYNYEDECYDSTHRTAKRKANEHFKNS